MFQLWSEQKWVSNHFQIWIVICVNGLCSSLRKQKVGVALKSIQTDLVSILMVFRFTNDGKYLPTVVSCSKRMCPWKICFQKWQMRPRHMKRERVLSYWEWCTVYGVEQNKKTGCNSWILHKVINALDTHHFMGRTSWSTLNTCYFSLLLALYIHWWSKRLWFLSNQSKNCYFSQVWWKYFATTPNNLYAIPEVMNGHCWPVSNEQHGTLIHLGQLWLHNTLPGGLTTT